MIRVRLEPRAVEKPWGATDLGPVFAPLAARTPGARIGEIWFEPPADYAGTPPALLFKYLFTTERLSVQVHPNDEQAQAVGLPWGKEEAWLITHAAPDATIGLGLTHPTTREVLGEAIHDGSIEHLIDWKPVAAGDHFHVTPGTIHAIGGGLTLIEVQQMSDTTYRLYDYGRPRELHIQAGLACSHCAPYRVDNRREPLTPGLTRLFDTGPFALVEISDAGPDVVDAIRTAAQHSATPHRWFLPLSGSGSFADGTRWHGGDAWLFEGEDALAGLTGLSAEHRALVAWTQGGHGA